MKIHTKLRLAAWVPALVACIIVFALFFSYRVNRDAYEKHRKIHRIVAQMHELNNSAQAYMLHHPERAKQQYILAHDSLSKFITSLRFADKEQQQYLEGVGRNLAAMRDIFYKLVSNFEKPAAAGDALLRAEVDERMAGQILIRSREGVSQALSLESLIEREITATRRRIYGLIFFLIASTTFPLALVLLRVMKNTAASLAVLRQGTEIVARGDLNHRIGLPPRDEIGELSAAFDRMTGQLRDTTVSRNELIKEVNERKAVEEELRRQQEWLRVLVSSIADAVIAADTSGRIIFINEIAASLTGWLPGEALGEPIRNVLRTIREKTREPGEDIVGCVLREGCVVNMSHSTALIRRNGREIPIEESAAPIMDSAGNMIGVVIVFRDVTGRRRAEHALRESRTALLRANEELEQRVLERTAELKKRVEQLARLSSELTLAEQRERRRLAEILHDHLQQLLVAAKMNCETLAKRIGSEQKQTVESVLNLITLSIQASRSLTAELSPPFLQKGGLSPALEWLVRWMQENHGLKIGRAHV